MANNKKPKDNDETPSEQLDQTPDAPADNATRKSEEDPSIGANAETTDTDENDQPIAGDHADDATGKQTNSAEIRGKWSRLWHWITTHKKFTIPAATVLILAILTAIPLTRYALAGLVVKQQFTIVITDSDTQKPVSAATVMLAGAQASSDAQGKATLHVRPGGATATIQKKYYQTTSKQVTVPLLRQKSPIVVRLKATGRQVPITVVNNITKKPLAGATITAAGTTAKTDDTGAAVLVLPVDKQTVQAQVSADGYNQATQTLTVTTQTGANTINLTPAGKLYFLSNSATGKIDVVKANLDGSDRQTILAGSGKEDQRQTVLLASRDWRYLALLSKRDGGDFAKLFLIDTSNDKVTTMDEGQATFSLTGWSDHRFIYSVNRSQVQAWQSNNAALKSYDAPSGSIAVLDQFGGSGDQNNYATSQLGTSYILKDEIMYIKNWYSVGWNGPALLQGKTAEVRSVHADGSANHVIKSFAAPGGSTVGGLYVDARLYEPQGIYLQFNLDSKTILEYEDGAVKATNGVSEDDFYNNSYPTYLVSPGGNNTFWAEQRDGKNTLFVGDIDGANKKQIASMSDYAPYGWFSDQYVLVSKNASELYIMPAAGGNPIKLTDYYKPALNYAGYGYGYGGL